MESLWTNVDTYFAGHLAPPDESLTQALASSASAGLPEIAVTPNQGKLLQMLARLVGATRILEIGTLGGYSTIWMARALPTAGELITLEIDPAHAEVARKNIEHAGLSDRVRIWIAPALESLRKLAAADSGPFDLVFIDADKANIDKYFEASLALCRVGSVIVVDNVVRKGSVVDPTTNGADIQGIRRFIESLAGDTRVTATAIQTVGSKGYDGFVIALVNQARTL